jgi:hypothetical protein
MFIREDPIPYEVQLRQWEREAPEDVRREIQKLRSGDPMMKWRGS